MHIDLLCFKSSLLQRSFLPHFSTPKELPFLSRQELLPTFWKAEVQTTHSSTTAELNKKENYSFFFLIIPCESMAEQGKKEVKVID